MTDQKKPSPQDPADKFTWKPNEVQWTRKPSAAQRLAARIPKKKPKTQ